MRIAILAALALALAACEGPSAPTNSAGGDNVLVSDGGCPISGPCPDQN